MTNRAYEWVAEAEAEERARLRAEARAQRKHKGRHVRPSRLYAAVITVWAAIKEGFGS